MSTGLGLSVMFDVDLANRGKSSVGARANAWNACGYWKTPLREMPAGAPAAGLLGDEADRLVDS